MPWTLKLAEMLLPFIKWSQNNQFGAQERGWMSPLCSVRFAPMELDRSFFRLLVIGSAALGRCYAGPGLITWAKACWSCFTLKMTPNRYCCSAKAEWHISNDVITYIMNECIDMCHYAPTYKPSHLPSNLTCQAEPCLPLLSMAALSVEHLKVRVYLLGGGVSMAALTVEHLKVRVYLLPLSNK